MSGLWDLLAVERNGHRSYGYECECGIQFRTKRPTADHIEHLRGLVDTVKPITRLTLVHNGRIAFERYGSSVTISMDIQDGNRTLKVYVDDKVAHSDG